MSSIISGIDSLQLFRSTESIFTNTTLIPCFVSPELYDVVIVSEDGTELQCHKCILVARLGKKLFKTNVHSSECVSSSIQHVKVSREKAAGLQGCCYVAQFFLQLATQLNSGQQEHY